MIQAIAQAEVEAAKAVILVVLEKGSPDKHIRTTQPIMRMSGPVLKQSPFGWKASDKDKYNELCNSEIEVRNIFLNLYLEHTRY